MKRIFYYTIPAEFDGKPLLYFLKAKKYSQPIITHLKRTFNGLLLNGSWAHAWDVLHTGDYLTVQLVENASSENIVPVPMDLAIVYEDEDLLVINKAAGVAIHPSQGHYSNTLANALAYHYGSQGEAFTYRCINRLDRDTTGLLIVAKHMYSASLLSQMAADHQLGRTYLAIASGEIPEEGMIDAPIARVNGSTIERCVDEERGEPARTYFKKISYKDGYSLVQLRLETGRTHQIRVHMKHIGHPLPGDFLYNPDYTRIHRQALHSFKLSFRHPITEEPMSFQAPIPEDMKAFL
ncbi:MAG TPA: RluA family pseudouridine synthase [Lachnospiraceae bacterium]|nr:RluA family pseudouridine synthase [Lachnospiraceae bacterium]